MDGGQQRFVDALKQFDEALTQQRLKAAHRSLEEMRSLANRASDQGLDPAADAQMRAMVGAQQERLSKKKAAMTKRAKTVQVPRKPNATCELCGDAYRRGKSETRRRPCYVCRPLQQSRSIQAVSGGLPTLGKGRR